MIASEDFKAAIDTMRSKFKKDDDTFFILDDDYVKDIPVISTGVIAVDSALGVGGVPRGRITEIYGPESSGKTTLSLKIIAACHKEGGTALFIDAEHAFDPSWAKKLGVDLSRLVIVQPNHGEEALEKVITFVKEDIVDLIVVDSVPSLVPKEELEAEFEKIQVGLQARLMSKSLRKIANILGKTKTAIIFINQVRVKIGGFARFGEPLDTPGGKALKFYASVRMETRKKDVIKDDSGDIVGILTKVSIKKNKVAAPFKEADFRINYEHGSDFINDMFDIGLEKGIIDKRGGWFYIDDHKAHGKDALITMLTENEEIRGILEEKLTGEEEEE